MKNLPVFCLHYKDAKFHLITQNNFHPIGLIEIKKDKLYAYFILFQIYPRFDKLEISF